MAHAQARELIKTGSAPASGNPEFVPPVFNIEFVYNQKLGIIYNHVQLSLCPGRYHKPGGWLLGGPALFPHELELGPKRPRVEACSVSQAFMF